MRYLEKINFISPYIELPKKLTVKQNLIVYGKLYSVKNLNSRIDYLVEELRLQNLLDRVTGELSSGQKNRISLAKAIINNPSVLLLDEPFVSLNAELREMIRMYIQELTLATLLVTHDLEEVESIADSVMKLEN